MLPIRPLAYADSSLETGICAGPRYTRSAPSRETPGTILSDITDKYVGEFNIPFMNTARTIKELQNNWSKLDPDQKSMILQIIDKFQQDPTQTNEDDFANTDDTDPSGTTTAFLTYLQSNPQALGPFLNSLAASGLNKQLNSYIASTTHISVLSLIILFLTIVIFFCLFYRFF